MNPESHPAPQEKIPVGLLDLLRAGDLAALLAQGIDETAMRRYGNDPSVRAAATRGYIERIGTSFQYAQEDMRKTIGLTDAEFRTPEAKAHAIDRTEFLMVNGELEPVVAIERLVGLGPEFFSSADALDRIERGIKHIGDQMFQPPIFSNLIKLPVPKEFFQRPSIREAAAKAQEKALRQGKFDAVDVMRFIGMDGDQFASLRDAAREGVRTIVSIGEDAIFRSYAEAFDIRPEEIDWHDAKFGYLSLIGRGRLDDALAFAQMFPSLTEERRQTPGIDLHGAAFSGIQVLAREGRFGDVERMARFGGVSQEDLMGAVNEEMIDMVGSGNGTALDKIRDHWNIPQETIQMMGENAIRRLIANVGGVWKPGHDVWKLLVHRKEITGLSEDRFEEAVIDAETTAMMRSEPSHTAKTFRIRALRAKLPIDAAFAARFERRLACAFLGHLLTQSRTSAIFTVRQDFPFLDDATVHDVAADTARAFLGTDPGRIEDLHNIQRSLKNFQVETLSFGELSKEVRAFLTKKNRYLNRVLVDDLVDGVFHASTDERASILGEMREHVRNELLFQATGKSKEYLDGMFVLYGLSWESFSLDQIPLDLLLSSKEPELVERARRDPWRPALDALAKLQGRSANEEHDPWKRELSPLVNRVTRGESLLDRNSAKDGALLVEYVKTFGMFDLPNVSRIYFRLKKGTFATLPEDDRRMLVELAGAKATRMESENLINEMRKLRPSVQGDLLADVVPRRIGTALGGEAFMTIRGSTQWDRGDRPGVVFETWTQTVEVAKADIVRLETEAMEAVKVRDDAAATRLYAVAREIREMIAVAPGYEETAMTVAKRQRREPIDAAVNAEIFRLMNLDELPDGTRGNVKIEAIHRDLVNVVRQSFEDVSRLSPHELWDVLQMENPMSTAPSEEALENLTALGNDVVLVGQMEALAGKDPLDENDARLLLMVSAIHLSRVAPTYWADILTKDMPLNITAGFWSVFTASYLKEHYLNPTQDKTHVSHAPFSETLRRALGRVWQAADDGPENELLRINAIFKEITLKRDILSKDMLDVALVPVQGPLRIYAGDIGDACYSSQHYAMARGEFPNVRAMIFVTNRGKPKERMVGSVLLVEARLADTNERAIVLRANNPRQNLVAQLDADSLVRQTVETAIATARRRGIKHVGVVRDRASAASSNREAVSAFYQREYKYNAKAGLIREPETNFNGYPIWNDEGSNPTVIVWSNEDPEAT